MSAVQEHAVTWGKVIDQTKCIGCHACTTACKAEHQVPLGVTRTYVKQVEVGLYPNVSRHFQITRCNQCENPPCVAICPVQAMYQREDGIVDFDRNLCIGCKSCIAACPYDAIYIDPESHSAEKCNFCAHRIDLGLEPACVVVCPEEAIVVGNLNDPGSEIAHYLARQKLTVRKPEKGTRPKVFYAGASQHTLTPSAAGIPVQHMWSEQHEEYPVTAPPKGRRGTPASGQSAAAALLAYDIPHKMPWDWRVSAYTWTKSVAAGIFLVAVLGLWLGAALSAVQQAVLAGVAGAFLVATAGLLVYDLEHPERFWTILVRPQWRSWVARGTFILTGYGALLGIWFAGSLMGATDLLAWLAWPGLGLAVFSAIYTALMFGQAKGRDLWQNPFLPGHFFVDALLAGAGAVGLLSALVPMPASLERAATLALAAAAAGYLLLLVSDRWMPHMTENAALASLQMRAGRYRGWYRAGVAAGGIVPLAVLWALPAGGLPWAGAFALLGLLAYEHAFIQGGQSVPLS